MSASKVSIFKGDDVAFKLLIKEGSKCYDLSNVTAASLTTETETGTITLSLGAGLTIPTPVNGEIEVVFTDAKSATLRTGNLNIELVLDESGDLKTLQFLEALEAKNRLY